MHGLASDWHATLKHPAALQSGHITPSSSPEPRKLHSRCHHAADEDVTSDLPATISSLSYSAATATLAAGTASGRVALWRGPQADSPPGATSASPMHHLDTDPSLQWMPQRCIAVPGSVDRVLWSRDSRLQCSPACTRLLAAASFGDLSSKSHA